MYSGAHTRPSRIVGSGGGERRGRNGRDAGSHPGPNPGRADDQAHAAWPTDPGRDRFRRPRGHRRTLLAGRSNKDRIERIGDFEEWYGSQRGESLRPVRMVLAGLGLDASAHRMVSQLADRAIDIQLVIFHGYVHDQEMLLARQVRAADDTRTSSAGPPGARDLNRKATERGVAAIRQDAQESLDYSVRTYYTKAGITCLQRTTTLPDGVRVRGSHCVTIGEAGAIRIMFHPAGGGEKRAAMAVAATEAAPCWS